MWSMLSNSESEASYTAHNDLSAVALIMKFPQTQASCSKFCLAALEPARSTNIPEWLPQITQVTVQLAVLT